MIYFTFFRVRNKSIKMHIIQFSAFSIKIEAYKLKHKVRLINYLFVEIYIRKNYDNNNSVSPDTSILIESLQNDNVF